MNQFVRDFEYNPYDTIEINADGKIDTFLCSNKYLRIIHQNIRSLSKNIDEFKVQISQLKHEVDIIVFTETFQLFT